MKKPVGHLIRINERGAARVLSGKAGMMFIVENWVGVDDRCAAVLDYRYPDASAVGGFQCWTIGPDGFEIIREAPPGAPVFDGNDIWEALFSICEGNVPDGLTEAVCQKLADSLNAAHEPEIISEDAPATAEGEGTKVMAEIEVPLERITNALIGAIEGGSTYWLNAFQCLPASADIRADLKARDMIWYAEEEFWTRGGGAHLEFDKPTEDSTGEANIGMIQLRNGLSVMAREAPRHFGDLVSENDDAITHDVYLQCVLFGEIIFG